MFAFQLLVSGLSITAGAIGVHGQSTALEQASATISTSRAHIRTARGKAGIPTFEPNMPAQSVRVGAGGQGAKADTPQEVDKRLSEQVGKMAEESRKDSEARAEGMKQETVLRKREDGEKPNPKKRMWEEPAGDVASSNKPKDEL